MDLVIEAYGLTKRFPGEERYALAQQLRRFIDGDGDAVIDRGAHGIHLERRRRARHRADE